MKNSVGRPKKNSQLLFAGKRFYVVVYESTKLNLQKIMIELREKNEVSSQVTMNDVVIHLINFYNANKN